MFSACSYRLSANDDAGSFQVFTPDISTFRPKPLPIKFTMNFMSGPANPDKTVLQTVPLMQDVKEAHPEIETWAIIGFNWGRKIAALVSQTDSLFQASGQCHPLLTDTENAKKVTIPMMLLPSMDEDLDAIEEYTRYLIDASPSSYCETFTAG